MLLLQRDRGEACSHVRDLLRDKVSTVRDRIRELGILEKQLSRSLRECERNLKAAAPCERDACPLLEEVSQRKTNEG